MGRIDEALRRVEPAEGQQTAIVSGPATAAPGEAGTDVFSSPWTFGGEEDRKGGAGTALAPAVSPSAEHRPHGRLALFKGFKPEVLGRIVAAPGAPSMLAEQFRRLAATLHHAQIVQGTKIIMVTSANPGDGKTLTSTNLALTLSESYRRQVLLIDADLRRPSLHDVFQVPNVVGLNDGLKAMNEARLEIIKITDSLTLLPAGRPDPDPMSSLASSRMREILKEGSDRFDWVIVDTAPLGLLADANLLSVMIDGALLVIRANQTPHADVLRAVESLGREKVLGVVLNAVEQTSKDSEYYGRSYTAVEPASATTPPQS
jgi:protein-tyrosine kinase